MREISHMTVEEAENYRDRLLELAEEERNEEWLFKAEELMERDFATYENEDGTLDISEAVVDAEKHLAWEIDDCDDHIFHYERREKEEEDYRYMVEVESRDW